MTRNAVSAVELDSPAHAHQWDAARSWAESSPEDSPARCLLRSIEDRETDCACRRLAARQALIALFLEAGGQPAASTVQNVRNPAAGPISMPSG